jgi:hypothetical protein
MSKHALMSVAAWIGLWKATPVMAHFREGLAGIVASRGGEYRPGGSDPGPERGSGPVRPGAKPCPGDPGQQANSTVTVSDITQDHRLTAAAAQVVSQSNPVTLQQAHDLIAAGMTRQAAVSLAVAAPEP